MASVGFKITRNDISPALTKLANAARNPEKVYRAMGTTFMAITMGNFNDVGSDYRPVAWPALKHDQKGGPGKAGDPSKLQLNNVLARNFFLEVTSSGAKVSNPTIYAATHQFGREAANIPARPFFPVLNGKLTPKAAEKIAAAGKRAIEKQLEK